MDSAALMQNSDGKTSNVCTITCIVDNEVQIGSLLKREHGLSFWVETPKGCVLFDTGQTTAVLTHNMACLGLSHPAPDALVLSHAHYDHTGGLDAILTTHSSIRVFAHSDIFQQRFSLRNGQYQQIGLSEENTRLMRKANLHLSTEPVEVLPGLWTTGEITDRAEPMGSSASHFIRTNNEWLPDPYRDDLSLVLSAGDRVILICGCCHAGLLNTMQHVRRIFQKPIHSVIGGSHLASATDEYLDHLIQVVHNEFAETQFHLNHCTGSNTLDYLKKALGKSVDHCPAGTTLVYSI